jgi:alpha-ketoglutarate-dependent taurine dioxygenase
MLATLAALGTINLRPLSRAMGFEVEIDPADLKSLTPTVASELRCAFAASRGLLLFRGLDEWTRDDMLALSSVFGEVEASPSEGEYDWLLEDDPRVHVFRRVPSSRVFEDDAPDGEENEDEAYDPETGRPSWHTDQSFRDPSPRASAMYCVKTPAEEGLGDTLFASTIAAFDALPAARRDALRGLAAPHSYGQLHTNFKRYIASADGEEEEFLSAEREADASLAATHPLVRTHRASGRECLYLAPMAMGPLVALADGDDEDGGGNALVENASDDELAALVAELTTHATGHRFRHRHRWRAGDFAVWDNHCTIHAATGLPADVEGEREMWRTTMLDDGAPEDPALAAALVEGADAGNVWDNPDHDSGGDGQWSLTVSF